MASAAEAAVLSVEAAVDALPPQAARLAAMPSARTVLMNFFMILPPILCTDPSHCRFKAAVCFNSNAKPRVMQEVWGIFAEKRIFMQGRGGRLRLDKGTAQRYNKYRKRHCDKRLVSFQ